MGSVPDQSLVELKELMGFYIKKLVWQHLRESRRPQSWTVYWQCILLPGLVLLFVKLWKELGREFLSRSAEKAFKDSLKKPYAGLWK